MIGLNAVGFSTNVHVPQSIYCDNYDPLTFYLMLSSGQFYQYFCEQTSAKPLTAPKSSAPYY